MKQILFITNRNVLTTCGELRLIKNRAEALWNTYGFATDFIALSAPDRIISQKRERIVCGGEMNTIPLPRKNFFGIIKAYRDLIYTIKEVLQNKKYDVVVLSGLLMPLFGKKVKKICGLPLIYDFHGAFEDTYESTANSNAIKKLVFRIFYLLENSVINVCLKHADGCFVVTEALKRYLIRRYSNAADLDYYVVPCAISDDCMSEEEYHNNRTEYRRKYGITEETPVFLYSGGTSSWQCIDETIDLFHQIRSEIKQPVKCLMFSHNISLIREKIGNDPDVITDSYTPEELAKALCAADYGFLLRKKCPTNQVAFPNKFLEYVRANLRMIATPNVEEIAEQVANNELGVLYNMDGNVSALLTELQKSSETYNSEVIQLVLRNNSFEYRLSKFAEKYNGAEI